MKVAKCLFLSLILVLTLPAVAQALTVVGTHTSLRADKTTVRAGTVVRFTGSLSSRVRDCYKHQSLRLYRNGVLVGSLSTGHSGSFSFSNTITTRTTYTVLFPGAIVGLHPDQRICFGSGASATVRICVPRSHLALVPPPRHPHPYVHEFSMGRTGTGCR